MRHPLCVLLFFAALTAPVCAEQNVAIQTSERSDMARDLILDEAATRGYSGDSIKLDFREPHSVFMRLYMIVDGEAELVQSSKPTSQSKSFEIGFLFRPSKEKGRELSFIFYDHDRPTKGLGSDLSIEQAKPHRIPERFSYSLSAMGFARKPGETVVFCAAERSIERADSLETTAKKIGSGYVITATLTQASEQDGGGQPATRSESK